MILVSRNSPEQIADVENSVVPTERDVIRGLQQGDLDAWDALCRQYSGRVWAYLSRLIGSDAAAVADVFQETMLAVAKSGRRLQDESHLWGWLAGIAHRQAALHWRRVYRDRQRNKVAGQSELVAAGDRSAADQRAAADPAEPVARGDEQPSQQAERKETIHVVRYVLAQLRSEYAVVLVAKYMEEMSVHQIVESIGGSVESVRSRLARARKEFRDRFDEISQGTHRLDATLWQELSSEASHPS